jgi:hypothetical protein
MKNKRHGGWRPGDWTEGELEILRDAYAGAAGYGAIRLNRLAARLGRHKSNVCRKARELGLTKRRRPRLSKPRQTTFFRNEHFKSTFMGGNARVRIALVGHPRGALGMKHTDEARARISAGNRASWADPNSKHHSEENKQRRSDIMTLRVSMGLMRGGYTRSAGGRRPDLENRYFRSSWEANYARYLNLLKSRGELADWEYESKTFVFEKIQRGTRAYTPDFKVIWPDGRHEWHEVKGWMDQPSRTRLKRMAKYFPLEVVRVIGEDWFKQATKSGLNGIIKNWETKPRRSQ